MDVHRPVQLGACAPGLLAAFRSRVLSHMRPAILEALREPCGAVAAKIHKHQLQKKIARSIEEAGKLIQAAGAGEWDEVKGRIVFYRGEQL